MSRQQPFTEEQIRLLRQNPYVFSIIGSKLFLTKEFKEIFLSEYNQGILPRQILENHGFDTAMLGDRRVWGISEHIRAEYKKHGGFHSGYLAPSPFAPEPKPSEADEITQLRHEVEYLKQEMDFLKKISSIRCTRK